MTMRTAAFPTIVTATTTLSTIYNSATITMMSLNKVVFFISVIAAAAATDETVASTPSFTKRELRGDAEAEASYVSSYDGSISMSYATSAKATKTKAAKSQEASSKSTKTKASKSYSMSYCEESECVDPNVPRFIVDSSVDVGDTLLHKKPDIPKRCGCDCYTIKDSGDDPPFDPQLGDTQRFAYKKVTSTNFSIKSRTCGVKCYGGDNYDYPIVDTLTYGRVGLQVRASLDPLAASVFISHKPHAQADWSWRKEYNGTYTPEFDGSPDVECLWITLTRDGNNFNSTYAYDPQAEGEVCESDFDIGLDQHVVIDMPDEVYVGMAVSSEIYDGPNTSCEYAKAAFESIEFVCEGDGC